MTTTIYIAPAAGDTHHPQCRIYACSVPIVGMVRDHYRANPDAWFETGLMNHRGQLVCFHGPDEQRQDLLDSQPLMAGLHFHYD